MDLFNYFKPRTDLTAIGYSILFNKHHYDSETDKLLRKAWEMASQNRKEDQSKAFSELNILADRFKSDYEWGTKWQKVTGLSYIIGSFSKNEEATSREFVEQKNARVKNELRKAAQLSAIKVFIHRREFSEAFEKLQSLIEGKAKDDLSDEFLTHILSDTKMEELPFIIPCIEGAFWSIDDKVSACKRVITKFAKDHKDEGFFLALLEDLKKVDHLTQASKDFYRELFDRALKMEMFGFARKIVEHFKESEEKKEILITNIKILEKAFSTEDETEKLNLFVRLLNKTGNDEVVALYTPITEALINRREFHLAIGIYHLAMEHRKRTDIIDRKLIIESAVDYYCDERRFEEAEDFVLEYSLEKAEHLEKIREWKSR